MNDHPAQPADSQTPPPGSTLRQSPQDQQQSLELSLQSTRPPADVPGYETLRRLGTGAFGEVWVGVDQNTGRHVAIKFFLHRGGVDWTLLSKEVEKLVYLSADRYVVQLLDVGWKADPPYYVMEYIAHGSLEDHLRERGTLPVGEAVELFTDIAVGLLHAHGKGVLHCDLKPANVLLDQDHKPRLADFGQSRLSHEQSPALGTLFYMAPEQADLNAVPDARWDVYALGAILYRMLTGEPPFRTDQLARDLETATGIDQRLQRYRESLRGAAAPRAHRLTPRVDRALADIVDRCLAVDPARRFANVQAVVDALQARSAARLRVPLLLLGFVGPLLLLAIMAWFGLRGYEQALDRSELAVMRRARESNNFAAKFAARSIEGEIARYFRAARREAEEPALARALAPVLSSELLTRLNAPEISVDDVDRLRPEFIGDPVRIALHDYLQRILDAYNERVASDPNEMLLASMFVVDRTGRMLDVAYHERQTPPRSVGWNYSYRTYFHGGRSDLAVSPQAWHAARSGPRRPISDAHFSAAFRSTSTDLWKVAISAPIPAPDGGAPLGVFALTVNLGDFAYFRANDSSERFAVFVDGRPGDNQGLILQHSLTDLLNTAEATTDFAVEYRLSPNQLLQIRTNPEYRYQDPLARSRGGEAYSGDWIAALEPVRIPDDPASEEMIVVVQERYENAIAPVHDLGSHLKREGIWAFVGVLGVVMVLWYIVIRVLGEPRAAFSTRSAAAPQTASIQNLATLPSRPPNAGDGN